VTHLVVEPHDRHHLARLVPVERAQARGATDAAVSLDCTVAEVGQLEPIQKSAYLRLGELPVEGPDWDVGIEETFALPSSQSLGVSALGAGVEPLDYDPHATVSYDRVPKGKVEVRRRSAVISSEGDQLGHVNGFVVDDEHQIAYLIMEHGHLWGKREVAIPTRAIVRMETDAVVLSLSRDEVGALKPPRGHRPES
jgi:PRC-barrel domain